MTDFQYLIAEAIAALNKVATHDDFYILLLEYGSCQTSISLVQSRKCLENLRLVYEKYLEDTKNEP